MTVIEFAVEMERQLQDNDHKSGWGHLDLEDLLKMLKEEVEELERAICQGDILIPPGKKEINKIIHEAADVANFAMMIADNAG